MTVEEKVTILKSEKEVKLPEKVDYKTFLNNLKEGKEVSKSLLCLFDTIKTNPKTLSLKDKERIINALVARMKKETVDLKKFFEEEIFSCFNIEKYKKQFLGLIRTVEPSNKNNLHRILGKLIDVSQDKNDIIKKILLEISKDNTYNDVFLFSKKSHDEIISQELEKLNDKDYVNVFCELRSLNKHSPRKITKLGNDKYKYVKKAIDFGFVNEIIPFYFNDKDVKIRQLLSSQKFANNASIISRFLNDHNPIVRCNMIDNLDVEDVIKMNFDVFDRVLDVDDSVRQKAFEFCEKFINYIKNYHSVIYFKNTEDKNLLDEKIKRSKTNIDEEEILDIVADALLNLFKGLNTIRQDEYKKFIDKLDLYIDFYVDYEKETGVEIYLENNRENVFKDYNYKDLNEDQRKIYFFYSNEALKDHEVKDLIKDDLMSAMVYLRDKDITNYIFEIYDEINDNDFHLKILTLTRLGKYKELLNNKIGEQPKDLVFAAFLSEKTDLDTSKNTFDCIFYQAKHGQLDCDHLNKCELSNYELFEIIIASKSLELLSVLTDRLFEDAEKFKEIFNERLEMNKKVIGQTLNEFILEGKHNLYLYVLLFGNIKSGCIDFFISFLHFLASSTRNKEKISKFYKKYLGNVSKNVFNEFASVCYNLKTKSMYPTNEQEYNVIHEKDEMLYFIIYIVLNYNVYEVNEKKYDLEKFYDVIEENLPLVLSKN